MNLTTPASTASTEGTTPTTLTPIVNATLDLSNDNTTLSDDNNATTSTTTLLPPTTMTMLSSLSSSSSSATTVVTSTTTTTATTPTTLSPTTTVANTWLGLSMSHTLLITVFTGCTALILLVLCAICCRLLCIRSKRQAAKGDGEQRGRQSSRRPQSSANHYADPRAMENHYHSNDVTKLYATPELTSSYARPEIYSTFINPSFYEEVYARWKLQEQTRFERTYDSPNQYSRRLKDQMDTAGFKWSANSLRALDNYDYETYGRIPRGKLTPSDTDKEEEDTVATETTPEFTTF